MSWRSGLGIFASLLLSPFAACFALMVPFSKPCAHPILLVSFALVYFIDARMTGIVRVWRLREG